MSPSKHQPSATLPATGYTLAEESELLLKLYGDVGTARFWQNFAGQLAALCDLNAAMLAISNLQSAEMKAAWAWNLDLENIRNYIAGGFAAKDDFINYSLAQPEGRFYSANIHLAAAINIEQECEVYQDWIAPQDIADVAMAIHKLEDGWFSMITLYRRPDQPDFSEQELVQLARLIPHVLRALQMHSELVESGARDFNLGGWLSLVKTPVLMFSETTDCCGLNDTAREFFARQQSIRLHYKRLELDDPARTRELGFHVMQALKAATGQVHSGMTTVEFSEGLPAPTTFVFVPVEDHEERPVTSVGALVFIHQQGFSPELNLNPLAHLFGLTPAERELCQHLLAGLSLQELARVLGKSKETLRSQLKHVFSKTGTSSQAELVCSLLTHPSVLAAEKND